MTDEELEAAMLHCNTVKAANVLAQDFEMASQAREVWSKLNKCKNQKANPPPELEAQYKNLKMPPEPPVADMSFDDLWSQTEEKLPKRYPTWKWNAEYEVLPRMSGGEQRHLEVSEMIKMLKDMSEKLGEPGYVAFKPRHRPKKFNVEVFEDGLDKD